jgi:hypothetical protein
MSRQAYVDAWIAYAEGSYGRSLQLAMFGLDQDRRNGATAGVAAALNLIGTLHYKHGEYALALRDYRNALKKAQEAQYSFGIGRDLSSIGSIELKISAQSAQPASHRTICRPRP